MPKDPVIFPGPCTHAPWWRHQMETFSALLAICAGNSPDPDEFPAQRPVTRSFDIFFDLRLNKRLSKQSWGWWFETLSCPLWCHCNALLAVTKQLYEWFSPSVCDIFSPCSHHRIIMNFSGVITNETGDVHAKGQGQRSKVNVTEVKTPCSRYRLLTHIWIHIWWRNNAQCLMLLGHLA